MLIWINNTREFVVKVMNVIAMCYSTWPKWQQIEDQKPVVNWITLMKALEVTRESVFSVILFISSILNMLYLSLPVMGVLSEHIIRAAILPAKQPNTKPTSSFLMCSLCSAERPNQSFRRHLNNLNKSLVY